MPEKVWYGVHTHLFSTPGEHFAFMLARWTYSRSEPVFMVRDAILIPDDEIKFSHGGWELATEAIVRVVNTAACTHSALIEVHNHGGIRPRFSRTDREGLCEFPAYILSSFPERPYGATVWGDSTVYGEFFLPDGRTGTIDSITVVGESFRQIVSQDDDLEPIGSPRAVSMLLVGCGSVSLVLEAQALNSYRIWYILVSAISR
jgi:proteasome lid subunit RPN8/RPN11